MSYLFERYPHDAFVSYAHGPGDPNAEDKLRNWTRKLAQDLEQDIRLILGTSDPSRQCRVWYDPKLGGNEPLTDTLRETIDQSALLVAVMSPFFLASSWCRDEVSWFSQSCQRRHETPKRRVFVVHAMPTDSAKWPMELCDSQGISLIGYPFHPIGEPHPFGWPVACSDDQDYHVAVKKLARAMSDQLRAMSGASPVDPSPRFARGRIDDRVSEVQTAPPPVVGTVFLGCMHDTLDEERDRLRAMLTAKGVAVLPPEDEELIDEASLNDAMNRHLRRADAMLLIANEYPCKWPRTRPGGFIGSQIEQAREINKHCEIWLNVPDLSKVRRPEYQRYLETLSQQAASAGLTIRHNDLASFADHVISGLTASKPQDGAQALDLSNAVICANHPQDEELGGEIMDAIKDILAELRQDAITFDFRNPAEARISSAALEKRLREASTILVLCFDQDWDWAKPFLRYLNSVSQVLSDGKVRLFVPAPRDRMQGDYDARVYGFRTADCTKFEASQARQRLREAMRKASPHAAGGVA